MIYRLLKFLGATLVLAGILIVLAHLVFTLPEDIEKTNTTALAPSPASELWNSVKPMESSHPGTTGIHPLSTGVDAFAARILLAREAKTAIDAQYYIWRNDLTGLLLLDELRKAAERGVRVRLLLDDNGIDGELDAILASLNSMENMEVRLFNPFVLRNPKPLNYAFDFFRLNHRMHNKSFTVDNLATVIGGRNVGNEYFDTGLEDIFLDLDVLAMGTVVPDVSDNFDRFWASSVTYPIDVLVADKANGLDVLAQAVSTHMSSSQYAHYSAALEQSGLVAGLKDQSLEIDWTQVRMVSDDPEKALGNARPEDLMATRLLSLLETPAISLDLVSAYFIPGKVGEQQFELLEKQGVNVRIMTNSLEATDVAMVHSGYTKYRRELLKAGVELFELKNRSTSYMGREELGRIGKSGSSLHAKTFAVDGKHLFVGSFNFDPRSARLNTEMGLMIESPALSKKVSALFDGEANLMCYKPTLLNGRNMIWVEDTGTSAPKTYRTEPGTTVFSRAFVIFAGWFPVEWLL